MDGNEPTIKSYYDTKQTLIFGKLKHAEEIEQIHIRNDYKQYGTNLINKKILNLPKSFDTDEIEIINSHKQEIEKYLNKIKIKWKDNKYYSVNNKNLANALGLKNRQIKDAIKQELKLKIEDAIMKVVFGDEKEKPENVAMFEATAIESGFKKEDTSEETNENNELKSSDNYLIL